MCKVIIVDDEKMIRLGIKKAVPWDLIGVEQVYVAKSGIEALEITREQRPEIMITDIKMDGMTGLDLIDHATKIVPDMCVMVLTGFDEFEYARKCIKLKVYDFFLKPVDENAIIEAIKNRVDYLKTKNLEKVADINENRAYAINAQMYIEKFLKDLVYNKPTNRYDKTAEFCMKYNYELKQQIQVAIIPVLYMEKDYEEDNFILLSVENICIGMVDAQNRGVTFIDDSGRIVIVFFLTQNKKSVVDWIHELIGVLRDEFNKKPKVFVGNPVNGLYNLNISYNDAISLLQQETSEYDDIIQTRNAQKKCDLFRQVFFEMKNAICSNINDRGKVMSILERFCQATDSYNLSDSYTRNCCFELASSIYYSYIVNSEIEAESRIIQFYNSLVIASGEESLEITKQFIVKLLENKEEHNVDEIVEKAKRYIKEHLSEDLSLPKIASVLYISTNYLSRLFKKATGEGCNEYIVRKRIEKAKLLLETTNLKANKIAMLVGYHDTNYFSLAVKKSVGVSPKKYREVCQQKIISG